MDHLSIASYGTRIFQRLLFSTREFGGFEKEIIQGECEGYSEVITTCYIDNVNYSRLTERLQADITDRIVNQRKNEETGALDAHAADRMIGIMSSDGWLLQPTH